MTVIRPATVGLLCFWLSPGMSFPMRVYAQRPCSNDHGSYCRGQYLLLQHAVRFIGHYRVL